MYNKYFDYGGAVSPLEQRFPTFLAAARADGKVPLVFFADASSPKLQRKLTALFEQLDAEPELAGLLKNCYAFGVRTDTTPWYDGTVCMEETKPFAQRRLIDESRLEQPILCLFNTKGEWVKIENLDTLARTVTDPETGEETVELNRAAVLEFFE